jgi:hypothetical protein
MRTPLTKAKLEYNPRCTLYLSAVEVVLALVLTGLSRGGWLQFLFLMAALQVGAILGWVTILLAGKIVSDSRFELDQEPFTMSSGDSKSGDRNP